MTDADLLTLTRRHFFGSCGLSLGSMALAAAMPPGVSAAPKSLPGPHFPPKAKSVIFLFMAGGPSQFELFEPKPDLQEYHGKPIPDSFLEGKRFAFMDTFAKEKPKVLGTKRKFARHGKSGAAVSDCLPETAKVVDDLCFLRAVATDVFNHAPAKIFMNTGSPQFGRPSMGSWVTYGIGSESKNLPGFVVLQSGPRGPRGGALNWGAGFLPTTYQGVPLRNGGEPILNLSSPAGVSKDRQRDALDALRDLNELRRAETGDAETTTRVNAYEMAFRMQTSAPELIDLTGETRETLALYGAEPGKASFANNCLLARRLVERGVRFVQLYHTDWDHHGEGNNNLDKGLDGICKEIDRPCAALIADLKRCGLLDDTLVVWGGEFGRTPMGEIRDSVGRNHHIDAYTMWMAGGGVKAGISHGTSDEFGFAPAEGKVHVHDLQATILHLLGMDHTKLTYRFQGRDFRLTDVKGEVVKAILA